MGFHAGFDSAKQGMLGRRIFKNCLDHHICLRHTIPFRVGNQAIKGRPHLEWITQALGEELVRTRQSGGNPLNVLILQTHRQTAQGTPGCNIAPHDPGTNDMHPRRLEVSLLAKPLQAFLQVKDAHQIASSW